jgi:hypothetical protein
METGREASTMLVSPIKQSYKTEKCVLTDKGFMVFTSVLFFLVAVFVTILAVI